MPYHIKELSATDSVAVFRALASNSRARIIELLAQRDMNINELSVALGIAQPSVTKHVQILEEAGLVVSDYSAGPQGTQKRCRRVHDRLLVEMAGIMPTLDSLAEIEVPVGMYTKVEAQPTCGLASREKFIGHLDDPLSFYLPDRAKAEIVWSAGGFVEYVFPNTLPSPTRVTAIDLAMEICSEAPGYDNDYPSDITVWVNDVEVGTWCSPGDVGGIRGRLNPPWWQDHLNQCGFLKVWQVDDKGTSVDGVSVSNVKVGDLDVQAWQATRIRIGVKPDAVHHGGFTLFGAASEITSRILCSGSTTRLGAETSRLGSSGHFGHLDQSGSSSRRQDLRGCRLSWRNRNQLNRHAAASGYMRENSHALLRRPSFAAWNRGGRPACTFCRIRPLGGFISYKVGNYILKRL